jgi:hypothetical protein
MPQLMMRKREGVMGDPGEMVPAQSAIAARARVPSVKPQFQLPESKTEPTFFMGRKIKDKPSKE